MGDTSMSETHCDALVFFGATGDLAYKKIFPSLQAMVKHGHLDVPVIGVAKSGWTRDQLIARARESLETHGGGVDAAAFATLSKLLRYVDGDYADAATFQALRKELGAAQRPAHYLAIPPALFATVVEHLAQAGCTSGARVIVEKPFGRDLESARALNAILLRTFDEQHIFRIDHYLGKRPVQNLVFFGVQGRGAFYDQTGTIRDVIQNHLFQVLANVAMEPPARLDSESIRDEKAKVLKSIPPLAGDDVVRGQFRGYRNEPGVAQNSRVETFAAVRLEIDSWRWQGVPFFIRAGKCLPVTSTEMVVRLRHPPRIFPRASAPANYVRFRIGPDFAIAIGATVMDAAESMIGQHVELLASQHAAADEMDAYERVLGDAMVGDVTLFAREDYVEEAWRIVDPVLKQTTPVFEYASGTWGPAEVGASMVPHGGWQDPVVTESDK